MPRTARCQERGSGKEHHGPGQDPALAGRVAAATARRVDTGDGPRHPSPVGGAGRNNGGACVLVLFTVEADIMSKNRRETGARKLQPIPPHDETDQNAALPEKPDAAAKTRAVGEKPSGSDRARPDQPSRGRQAT